MHKEQCIGPVPGAFQCVSVADGSATASSGWWVESKRRVSWVIKAWVGGATLWTNSLPLLSGLNWTLRRCKRRTDTVLSVVLSVVSSFFKSLFCWCAVKNSGGFTAEPFLTHNRPGNDQSKDFTTTYVEGRSLKIKLTCITSLDCLAIGHQGAFFFLKTRRNFFLAVWHFIFFLHLCCNYLW